MSDIIEWIHVNEELPPYGMPVLIKSKTGVIQNITYILEGADDTPDWFEPHYFDNGDDLKIWWNHIDSWATFSDWQD